MGWPKGKPRGPLSEERKRKFLEGGRLAAMRPHPPKEPRICESCAETYQPNGVKQRWCDKCSGNGEFLLRLLRYGVSKPMWDEMIAHQGGHCALCPRPAVHVDHNHETGEVRGGLCNVCNMAMNRVESEGWLERARIYKEGGYRAIPQ